MKYVDLCVMCIKNVLRNDDGKFNEITFEDARASGEYGDLINNVDIDINSAIHRLITSDKIPTTEFVVDSPFNIDGDRRLKELELDISSIANDVYSIKYIYFVDDRYGERTPCAFKTIGNKKVIVKSIRSKGKFYINYVKSIPMLDSMNSDDRETDLMEKYNISDLMCTQYILNFTKAKLWEEDEPQLSQNYMNYAEQFLSSIKNDENGYFQSEVEINEWNY